MRRRSSPTSPSRECAQAASRGPKQRSHTYSACAGYWALHSLHSRWVTANWGSLRSCLRPVTVWEEREGPPPHIYLELAPSRRDLTVVARASKGQSLHPSGCVQLCGRECINPHGRRKRGGGNAPARAV